MHQSSSSPRPVRFLLAGAVIALTACTAATTGHGAPSSPGSRDLAARSVAVPTQDVSPEMQALIGQGFWSSWNADPKTAEEWHALIDANAEGIVGILPALRSKLHVTVEPVTVGGVSAYMVTPESLPPENANRLLLHLHAGGYVFGPGEAGTLEAIEMAGLGGYRVLSVDYRMPPEHPFPAAMDDAMAAYKAAIGLASPANIGVFGSSAGGAMTLALVLRAEKEGLPLPGAIAPSTPWSDLTETGDSYFTNEGVDNVLVSWKGWLGKAAALYANGVDLKDPQLSPIYGDLQGFPPTILTTGTRDLFLSNTVRTHRKLRQAGVTAELNVYEGQSHAQYLANADAPETREVFQEIGQFFDKHLGK